jgi:LDH2 family malate/lactate/ureidoglycolate dehydrogenase
MSQSPSLITAEALKQFCPSLLIAAGLSHADAELVADSLVEANLRGLIHGVARLPRADVSPRGASIPDPR